ncbi:uroporphyrinogen-III C-methyltransferase [filamentous cyanobacterium CCP5]|nr:uroporphyrinogen-III C-methyltransferase [filamentous cyanobacterium CCP5]
MAGLNQTVRFGKVYLVGAGPGDPGLLTLRGKTLLECADVVIHDALVSDPILQMITPQAEVINAGKRRGNHSMLQPAITDLLLQKARSHAVIVRLKGGDPYVFGRGGEEMLALVEAGVPVEVVPGITAGVAAPAYAGIPVTHREYSSSVMFITGHEAAGKYRPDINWQAVARAAETIVIYMGIRNLPNILAELSQAGLPNHTPIALVRWGTRPEQEELVGTLDDIVAKMSAAEFSAPAVAVIGQVVDLYPILRVGKPALLGEGKPAATEM